MKKKQLIAMGLAGVMAMSVAACGGTKETPQAKQEAKQEVESSAEATKTLPSASDDIIKIGDGSASFDLWMQIHPITAEAYKNLGEHPGAKLWEEKTGVKVNYINPPVGEEKKNLNLLLNDPGSLPDAFAIGDFDSIYPGGTMMAIEDGVIIDITEMVEQYAPNFMAMINADEKLKKDVYNDDGVMVGFGTIIVNEARREKAMYGPIINQTYLEKAGLEVPTTIAEWEEMLTAFKEMGVKAPLSFDPQYMKDCFAGAFGVPSGGGYYIDVEGDGKVHYAGTEENYKEFLTVMNRWYENGLIDADYATRKLNQDILPMMVNGNAGSYVGYVTAFKQLPTNATAQGFDELKLVGAPFPSLNKGDQVHLRDFENNRTDLAVYITSNAEDPISIIQWFDQMYSLAGRRINTFGEEGVTYEMVDGVCTYTDFIIKNPDGLSMTQAGRKYIFKDMFRTWEDDDHAQLYTEESQFDAWDKWDLADKTAALPRLLTLSADEADEYVKISSTLNAYAQEMQQKFIMGTADIETEWDNFVATLESLECNKAAEIRQAAYERYLSR